MVGVHATGRLEVGEIEVAASVLNAFPQYVQHTSTCNLVTETGYQLLWRVPPVLTF